MAAKKKVQIHIPSRTRFSGFGVLGEYLPHGEHERVVDAIGLTELEHAKSLGLIKFEVLEEVAEPEKKPETPKKAEPEKKPAK